STAIGDERRYRYPSVLPRRTHTGMRSLRRSRWDVSVRLPLAPRRFSPSSPRAGGPRVPSVVWLRGLVALSLVMGGAAIAKGSARSEPPGPAPSRETAPLSFDPGALAQLNGVAPRADAT